jgi:hypothetical protein
MQGIKMSAKYVLRICGNSRSDGDFVESTKMLGAEVSITITWD